MESNGQCGSVDFSMFTLVCISPHQGQKAVSVSIARSETKTLQRALQRREAQFWKQLNAKAQYNRLKKTVEYKHRKYRSCISKTK